MTDRMANRDWVRDELERVHGPVEDWPVPPKFYSENYVSGVGIVPEFRTRLIDIAIITIWLFAYHALILGIGIAIGHWWI